MVDHRGGHLDPAVVPKADFIAPVGVFLSRGIDRVAEVFAAVDAVVHAVQIDGVEHCAAAVFADDAVVEAFRLPFDQHIADVENDCLWCHITCPDNSLTRG